MLGPLTCKIFNAFRITPHCVCVDLLLLSKKPIALKPLLQAGAQV
jgi:hypothetical protein